MRLLFHRDAEAQILALADDPARADLFADIIRTVRMIRAESESAQARQRALRSEAFGQVWAVPVRDADDNWIVVWRPEDPDVVMVLYVVGR